MPAFTSYTNLKQNISDYLARQDLTTQIPMFISLAEKRLNRDLRLRQTLQQSTYTMSSGFVVPTPADFLEMQDIHLDANPIIPLTLDSEFWYLFSASPVYEPLSKWLNPIIPTFLFSKDLTCSFIESKKLSLIG